jgi:exonuclease SbcD
MQRAMGGLSGSARATLTGELATEIDIRPHDMPTDHFGLDSVLVEVGDLHVAYDFEDIAKEQTIRGEFVREVLEQDLTEEQQRILVTGIRALDGRDDLDVS